MTNVRSTFLKIAAVCSFVGPIVLLLSDIILLATDSTFEWTVGLWAAFMLLIPAVFGFTYLLASHGSRLAFVGGGLAFFGLMAGASMQVLFRVHAVLAEQGALQTVEQLRSTFKLVAITQMIGIAWPIGLIVLAIASLTTRAVPVVYALLLFVGAIAFPIGRIAGSTAGVLVSGAVFVIAFGMIGQKLISLANENEASH